MKKNALFMSLLMSGVLAGCSLVQNPGTVDTDLEDEVSEEVTENEDMLFTLIRTVRWFIPLADLRAIHIS